MEIILQVGRHLGKAFLKDLVFELKLPPSEKSQLHKVHTGIENVKTLKRNEFGMFEEPNQVSMAGVHVLKGGWNEMGL